MWIVTKINGYWLATKLQKLRTFAVQKNYNTEYGAQDLYEHIYMGIYHKAMLINRKKWKENQYPEQWSSKVEPESLSKNHGAKLIPTKTETRAIDDKRDEKTS